MKCYYEVLDVPRDADATDIKTSYRKLALKWHPDKNLNSPDEAKEQFQLVQNAYEVLSDPQERAWYDNHREQLLKGAGTTYNDETLDLIPYFTASCFKGYGDDGNGFYEVYREVFKKLASEEVDYLDDPEDVNKIPQFGKSDTEYEKVQEFYSYWISFTTSKSYVWLDKYDIREADNRKILKLLEKENQKIRQRARRERNEEIRQLVAFVRKRDKRVVAYNKLLEEKAKENKEKLETRRKEGIKKRQEELEEAKQKLKDVGIYNMNNFNEQLNEIEKHLFEEFGQSEDDTFSDDESDENECLDDIDNRSFTADDLSQIKNLFCIACNKSFRNIKSFENHEKSKKHKENVINLKHDSDTDDKDHSLKSNENNGSINSSSSEEVKVVTKCKKKKSKKTALLAEHAGSDSEDGPQNIRDLDISLRSRKARRAKNLKQSLAVKIEDGPAIVEDGATNATEPEAVDGNQVSSDEKQKSKKKKAPKKPTDSSVQNQDNGSDSSQDKYGRSRPKKKIKEKKPPKKIEAVDLSNIDEIDLAHCCVVCKSNFPSKNKLFDHLKKTGHQIYIPTAANEAAPTTKTKKKKK